MPNTKTGTTWAPDIRPESIETFTETYTPDAGTEQTLTYKRVADHPILNGIRDIKAFFTTHVGAVWYNLQEHKTLLAKLNEMDAKMEDLKNKTSSSTVLDLESTFQSAPVGMSPVHTYVNSQNLPDISTEWKYCSGFVTKRDNSNGGIVLFGRLNRKMAINSTADGGVTWIGWEIK